MMETANKTRMRRVARARELEPWPTAKSEEGPCIAAMGSKMKFLRLLQSASNDIEGLVGPNTHVPKIVVYHRGRKSTYVLDRHGMLRATLGDSIPFVVSPD